MFFREVLNEDLGCASYIVADGSEAVVIDPKWEVEDRSEEPWLVITGDSLFVGDLARPDLAVEPKEGARGLFSSLRKLADLEDYVEVRRV